MLVCVDWMCTFMLVCVDWMCTLFCVLHPCSKENVSFIVLIDLLNVEALVPNVLISLVSTNCSQFSNLTTYYCK